MTRRWPAEWEHQSGLMLTWPHPETDWHPFLQEVEPVFTEIARHAARHQTVLVACHDARHREQVDARLQATGLTPGQYRLYIAPSNDSWARDHGPIAVLDDERPLLLDFVFNGWGGKFPADLDNCITRVLHQHGAFGNTPLLTTDFVLEGGSIETDGQGTLLTTTSCLLSPARNPGPAHTGRQQQENLKTEIENRLKRYLGVHRVLWLEHGRLQGDDTDGHIDTLARFAGTDTIVYAASADASDPNYASLRHMAGELKQLTRNDGAPYRLVPLPSPVIRDQAGKYLPASYVNFALVNELVLVPVYGVDMDVTALETIRQCFVSRHVVGINCRPLIQQYGSLHCVTMQLPAGIVP